MSEENNESKKANQDLPLGLKVLITGFVGGLFWGSFGTWLTFLILRTLDRICYGRRGHLEVGAKKQPDNGSQFLY